MSRVLLIHLVLLSFAWQEVIDSQTSLTEGHRHNSFLQDENLNDLALRKLRGRFRRRLESRLGEGTVDDVVKDTEKKEESESTTGEPKKEGTTQAAKDAGTTTEEPKKEETTEESKKDETTEEPKSDENEKLKQKIQKLKDEAAKNKKKADEAEKKEKLAEKAAQKAKDKLEKEKEKNAVDDEQKKIMDQSSKKDDKEDMYVGSFQFPIYDPAKMPLKGYVIDITKEDDPEKLTNMELSLMKSNKPLYRPNDSGKECPFAEKKCQCGFSSFHWFYTKLEGVKDYCFGVVGKCVDKCDTTEKMVGLGFDYNIEIADGKKKGEIMFVEKPQNDEWVAGHVPLYKFECNEGYVITKIRNKYMFGKKSESEESEKPSHQKIGITCGKPKIEMGDGSVKWYNCFTRATKWNAKKRKWCREVRKNQAKDGASGNQDGGKKIPQNPNLAVNPDEPKRKRNLCEDVKEIGKDKKSCAERMKELKENLEIKSCPKSLAEMCPLSCGTCCGDNPTVMDAKGNDTGKPCSEHVAELKKVNQGCTDLLKGQCPRSCGLCKMPGDSGVSLEESLSLNVIPPSYSHRLAYAISFFLVLFGLFIYGCFRTFDAKGEDLYVEFMPEDSTLSESFLDTSHTSGF